MVADRYRSFMRIVRILSIILAVLGVVKGWENLLFGAILILWGHNMMFSLKNQEGRLPFLLFHITFFTFLYIIFISILTSYCILHYFSEIRRCICESSVFNLLVL
mgnify:CR=1 FL=1